MQRISLFSLTVLLALVSFTGCKSHSPIAESTKMANVTGPQVVIYKTTHDYFLQVPVSLSTDKKSLVSYPAPGDLYYNGDLAYPVKLEGGFLLDHRGITAGCAFLKLTYYEYSRLDHTPDPEYIMEMILDADPLTEMYQCGRKSNFKDLEGELNQAILKGELSKFKKIK